MEHCEPEASQTSRATRQVTLEEGDIDTWIINGDRIEQIRAISSIRVRVLPAFMEAILN